MARPHWLVRCGKCGHVGTVYADSLDSGPRDGRPIEEWIENSGRCEKCRKIGGHRATPMGGAGAKLVGAGLNTVSDPVYHLPSCKWVAKMNVNKLEEFMNASQAEFRGYRPCKVCKPDQAAARIRRGG